MTQILEQNVQRGTGVNAQIGRPAAGKTGTATDFANAWFCGYTPDLATAVWVGYPQGNVPMTDVHGIEVEGGSFPAEIWAAFMKPAEAQYPVSDFPVAKGVLQLSPSQNSTPSTTSTSLIPSTTTTTIPRRSPSTTTPTTKVPPPTSPPTTSPRPTTPPTTSPPTSSPSTTSPRNKGPTH